MDLLVLQLGKRQAVFYSAYIWTLHLNSIWNDGKTIILTRKIAIRQGDQDYENLALSIIGLDKNLNQKQKVDPSAIHNQYFR